MTTVWKIPFPVAPILAALAVGLLGVIIGLPALRVRGVNLAIVTVVMAVAINSVYFDNDSLNGGINGGQVTGPTLFGLNLEIGSGGSYPRIQFGLLCLVVLTLVALGVANLRRSRLGRADARGPRQRAVRRRQRDQRGAREAGRLRASPPVIAGLGGALLGYQQTSVSGDSFDPLSGILLFGICYIAGITTITGAVAAGLIGSNGLIYVIINRQINFGSYYLLITGLILIFAIIRHPEGLGGTIQEPLERLARRVFRRKPPAATPALGAAVGAAHRQHRKGWCDVAADAVSAAPLLSVAGLTVRYGGVVALDSVSLSVPAGGFVGLIGPNGAGKTTFVDALTGFTRYSGEVRFDGARLDSEPAHVRARHGLARTFQSGGVFDDLTVEENILVGERSGSGWLSAVASVLSGRSAPASQATREIIGSLGLTGLLGMQAEELSEGQRKLVAVAQALASKPKLLLLDEPAAGLDSAESAWLGQQLLAVRDTRAWRSCSSITTWTWS